MRFGEYIKKLREEKQLTLAQASEQLGLTPQRLCDIEHGRRNFQRPPYDLIKKVAAVYDHPYAAVAMNSEFFAFEKSVLEGLLEHVEPIAGKLEAKALDMLVEAKQYTPEMEAMARSTHKLASSLKLAIFAVRSQVSGRAFTKISGVPRSRRKG